MFSGNRNPSPDYFIKYKERPAEKPWYKAQGYFNVFDREAGLPRKFYDDVIPFGPEETENIFLSSGTVKPRYGTSLGEVPVKQAAGWRTIMPIHPKPIRRGPAWDVIMTGRPQMVKPPSPESGLWAYMRRFVESRKKLAPETGHESWRRFSIPKPQKGASLGELKPKKNPYAEFIEHERSMYLTPRKKEAMPAQQATGVIKPMVKSPFESIY